MSGRILKNHAARASEDVTQPDVPVDELFEEILLSYRVIFGQDERSWKAFSHTMQSKEDHSEPSTISSWEPSGDFDPMLHVVCGESAEKPGPRQIYDEIEAPTCESRSVYVPHVDFRFLGKRLLDLQDFVDQHQPKNVRGLLNDRRDVAAWYMLWNNQACNPTIPMFGTLG